MATGGPSASDFHAWPAPLPGAPPPVDPKLKKSIDTLSLVLLISSLLELLWCLYRLASQLVAGPALKLYFGWLSTIAPHAPVGGLLGPVDAFMDRIALAESLRTIPFLVCSSALLWIAIRVRRGDLSALATARKWCFWALGAVAVSAAIQVTVIVPATLEYTAEIMKRMPHPPAGAKMPFDVQQFTSSITIISTVFSVFGSVVFFSLFPIGLYIWAGKLQKRFAPAPAS